MHLTLQLTMMVRHYTLGKFSVGKKSMHFSVQNFFKKQVYMFSLYTLFLPYLD